MPFGEEDLAIAVLCVWTGIAFHYISEEITGLLSILPHLLSAIISWASIGATDEQNRTIYLILLL